MTRYVIFNTNQPEFAPRECTEGTLEDINAIFAFTQKKHPSEGSLIAWCNRNGYRLYRHMEE
jgi:hypothetical protein